IVGNGPFVLRSWRQGDRLVFDKNPRYWDAARVRLDHVVALSLEDLNTMVNLHKAGLVDLNPRRYVPAPFIPYLADYSCYRRRNYQAVAYYWINVTRKPFDKVWVRRALAYAMDRDAIARGLLKGSRMPWGNFVPIGYPGYSRPPGQTYDPARA